MARPKHRPDPEKLKKSRKDWSHLVAEEIRPILTVECPSCLAPPKSPCFNRKYIEEGDDPSLARQRRATYWSFVHKARRELFSRNRGNPTP